MTSSEKREITSVADIELLVYTFYDKVRADALLFPIFDPVIKNNWPAHLQKMVRFWSTLLLYTREYKDDPLTSHMPLPLAKEHFERWLALFHQTLDDLFIGEIAENAKKRAFSIARIMKAVKGIETKENSAAH
ncbi:sec-independent protein translocase TatC [Pelobium manganitolerans]|uniref:Sec-independent protein translocase TatC n=1 Tax=Pelobium manganitolerans TaxID=1842495 RepID=A0A419S5S4_9SPHI|nr:group III truncated hemoglobin [Pelobium manganitolerans]RKD16149.1 sec-independent protein translocase TatC [Pelobium manganitolerans]